MITVHEVEQGSDEWQELRAGKYTGSNAHKLLRHGAGTYALTEQNGFGGNFWTKRGHLLETEAVELYERIARVSVDRPGFVTNDRYPRCGYSPDGLVLERALLEVKCFDEPKHLKLIAGDISLEILAQVHFGMLICERKIAYLLPYNPKLEPRKAFKIIPIKFNRAIANNFKRILSAKEVQIGKI
ncbi:MAG TPA: YqaJ viral recombinase family protein [Chthoniobacterales bacterium]|nr:YqaJ viral recombinase family protein [Chthoniobacterales bacterium]